LDAQQTVLPRVLVTGFSVFPGAPLNPTEHLIPLIEAERDRYAALCEIVTDVYPVDYQSLPMRLQAACRERGPDIAIHFGLSARAQGITIERVARNALGVGRPDNTGFSPAQAHIAVGGEDYPSTLPVDALYENLAAAGLPVSYSDDAGDYLCNYIFYLARAKSCPGFAPDMAGFIHVPPLRENRESDAENAMTLEQLLQASRIIIETCCRAHGAQT
jgi:pyroglutamyl-peptidase